MNNATAFDATPKVDAEYESAIDRYLAEMEKMKIEMDERQTRIDRMRAETEAVLAGLKLS